MASQKNPKPTVKYSAEQLADIKFGIVTSAWNHSITGALHKAAVETLIAAGVSEDNIEELQVPGAFELPLGARMLIAGKNVDAVICLGCVVKGETRHDEYINQAVATGLTQLSLTSGRPCLFGLLTTENEAQAIDRAGGKHGNKGAEAAETAIHMAILRQQMGKTKNAIGF